MCLVNGLQLGYHCAVMPVALRGREDQIWDKGKSPNDMHPKLMVCVLGGKSRTGSQSTLPASLTHLDYICSCSCRSPPQLSLLSPAHTTTSHQCCPHFRDEGMGTQGVRSTGVSAHPAAWCLLNPGYIEQGLSTGVQAQHRRCQVLGSRNQHISHLHLSDLGSTSHHTGSWKQHP